jgi:NitT/TauT family transport system substrate-binding protein
MAEHFKDLKNYKNKKIATVRLSTGDIVFKGALTETGIDWKKDVAFSELDTPASVVEAVKKGSVDAGIVWSPYRTLAQSQGLMVVKQSGEVYKNHVCCMQVALTSKLNEDPKSYESFERSLIKAYSFLINNKEETIDIISKYVKIDKKVIEEEAYGTFIGNSPDPSKAEIERTWKLMNDAGFISSDVNIDTHINTGIYKNALDDILTKYAQDEVYKKLKADFKE